MLKRLARLLLLSAVVTAVVYLVRSMRRDQDPLPAVPDSRGDDWPPLRAEPAAAPTSAPSSPAAPTPASPPASEETESSGETWVEATADGECPDGYPIKANMNSGIFHAPGQLAYDRTHPDRCYTSEEAAESDGLRAAKR